jgi:hypothetical protein
MTEPKVMNAHNELFAIREGERAELFAEPPLSGFHIAVKAVPVTMPDGRRQPTRQTDGAPVEQACIVACQLNADGLWQWVHLSPATKENVGDLIFDGGLRKDCWYYLKLTPRG